MTVKFGAVSSGSWPAQLTTQVAEASTEPERVAALVELVEWLSSTDPRAARPRAAEALEAAQRLEKPALVIRARRAHATALLFTLGPRRAYEELRDTRQQAVALGDTRGLAWCDHLLGIALEFLGDPGGATVHLERALNGFRHVGDRSGEARALTALGNGRQILGELTEALRLHLHAADLAQRADDSVTHNIALVNAGEVRALLGVRAAKAYRADEATGYFHAALRDFQDAYQQGCRIGDASREPIALSSQVLPLCWLDRVDEAIELAERALKRAGELELDHRLASALQAAGMAYVVKGDLSRAISYLQRGIALVDQWDLTYDTVHVLRLLFEAYERCGDVTTALATHKRLLAAELRLRDKVGEREDQVVVARFEAERRLESSEEGHLRLQRLARVHRRLIDERRAMERLAHTDSLTGLANRRHFDAQLARLLLQAELTAEPLSLIMVDVDHFKQINDENSHLTGDEVLRTVAREINRHCRVTDLACRIGGEEFVVLLPGTSLQDGYRVAERLRGSVAHLDFGQIAVRLVVTISAGIACCTGGDASTLIAAADKALYQAKASGRNRVCSAEDL